MRDQEAHLQHLFSSDHSPDDENVERGNHVLSIPVKTQPLMEDVPSIALDKIWFVEEISMDGN